MNPIRLLFLLLPLCAAALAEEAPDPAKDKGRAETLFAKVRGADRPQSSPAWKDFLAHPAALAVAREHLKEPAESDRGIAAALAAVAALEPKSEQTADDFARYALEARSERVRQTARESLKGMRLPTSQRVIHALKAPRELGLRALDLIKDNPDEKGLFGIVVAADDAAYGGGGPRSYIHSGTQTAYVKDITAVVQVQAVGYDPEIGYVQTATVLDAKVLKVEELRRTFYEITGVAFDTSGKAKAWWEAHKGEVLKRIEEKSSK